MKQLPAFVGIDISKLTLDICVLQGNIKQSYVIDNELKSIKVFFTKLACCHNHLHIGMENTGCYNYHLYQVLNEIGLDYYVIPPIHLKKSLGLSRGKNDKVDAIRITSFVELNLKHLSVYKPQRAAVKKLQVLLTCREQRIKIKKQLQNSSEQYAYMPKADSKVLTSLDNKLIAEVKKQIKTLEIQIQELVAMDEQLSASFKLITTVQGVGKILGWHLLVRTGEFNGITSPRKLACYAGVVPFEHRSGTSIRGKNRVSHYADKNLKRLLHLAAMSAIRLIGDLKDYFDRKVAEGKNKMSVLNAVRNKIIHRVYAVLKYQRAYEKYLSSHLVTS